MPFLSSFFNGPCFPRRDNVKGSVPTCLFSKQISKEALLINNPAPFCARSWNRRFTLPTTAWSNNHHNFRATGCVTDLLTTTYLTSSKIIRLIPRFLNRYLVGIKLTFALPTPETDWSIKLNARGLGYMRHDPKENSEDGRRKFKGRNGDREIHNPFRAISDEWSLTFHTQEMGEAGKSWYLEAEKRRKISATGRSLCKGGELLICIYTYIKR